MMTSAGQQAKPAAGNCCRDRYIPACFKALSTVKQRTCTVTVGHADHPECLGMHEKLDDIVQVQARVALLQINLLLVHPLSLLL